jgi:endoglucanase
MNGILSVIKSGIFYTLLSQNGTEQKPIPFSIRGVSWAATESCANVVGGLWAQPLTSYLDFLQKHKFNVLRLPFSEQWILDGFETIKPQQGTIYADPSLYKLTTLQIIDKIFDECEKRNIFILLDMHRLECSAQSHEVWYSLNSPKYTYETFVFAWRKMVERYGKKKNLFGYEILNEPRGLAEWSNNSRFSMNLFYEAVNRDVFSNSSALVLYSGIDWGRSYAGMREYPIRNVDPKKAVYSSHDYGPSVVGNINMDRAVLHSDWNRNFGFLQIEGKPVVITEYGGRYVGADKEWLDMFTNYLISLRIPGIFWNLLDSGSSDTGGLIQHDHVTPHNNKLELVKRLVPNPTIIDLSKVKAQPRKLRGHDEH